MSPIFWRKSKAKNASGAEADVGQTPALEPEAGTVDAYSGEPASSSTQDDAFVSDTSDSTQASAALGRTVSSDDAQGSASGSGSEEGKYAPIGDANSSRQYSSGDAHHDPHTGSQGARENQANQHNSVAASADSAKAEHRSATNETSQLEGGVQEVTLAERGEQQQDDRPLIDVAYDRWHEELSHKAQRADEERRVARNVVVDLTHPHPTGAAQLFSHTKTRLSSLIREPFALERAQKRLAELRELVTQYEAEYSYAPISLSMGRISWVNSGAGAYAGGDEPPVQSANEPAIFRRVIIEHLADGDANITLTTHVELNPAILHALAEHGAPSRELAELRGLINDAVPADELLRHLLSVAKIYLPSFAWEQESLLGCFIRPEHAILADFEAMEGHIKHSGVMAALAGDDRRRELTSAPLPPILREDRSPEVERGAGDLDAVELGVVEAVAAGRSLVLDAVPGSKRFKVIASMVADAAASGKSVMFVPARTASTQALIQELDQLGLGELLLDLSDVSHAAMRIRTGLRVHKPEVDFDHVVTVREELVQTRTLLEDFVGDLHREDPTWGVSVHDLLEHLAQLTSTANAPRTRVRLTEDVVRPLHARGKDEVVAQLERGFDLGVFDRNLGTSAWNRSEIIGADAAKRALEAARSLNDTLLPELVSIAAKTAGETGLRAANTLAEWFEQLQVLKDISHSLDTFLPKVFETSPMDMIAATATKEWREENGYTMKARDRRDLRKQAEDLVRPGANPEDLHQALLEVQERREVWQRYAEDGGWPILPSGVAYARQNAADVQHTCAALQESFPSIDFLNLSLPQLVKFVEELVRDEDHLDTVPERNQLSHDFHSVGLDPFVADMRARGVERDRLGDEYELALTSSIFEILITRSAVLAKLGPRDITHLLSQLRVLDAAHIESLGAPVALAVVHNMRAVARERREETLRLDAILQRIGDGDMRAVFERYAPIVQASRPVWIVPPVVAAEFVPQMPWADLSIIETSDVSTPASVIAPMMRGRQTVVVGDTRRAAMIHEHVGGKVTPALGGMSTSAESAMLAFAEILPVVTLPTLRALQDEATTRALMEHGYADAYSPIPTSLRVQTSHLVTVDGRGIPQSYGSGTVETTKVEVEAVVDAVVDHVLGDGSGSLAVVALTQSHASQIRDALRKAARESVELARFIDDAGFEDFRVVDLTHAAGLRRDHIILAVGFGKTVHGRVLHSFGQLAEPEGFIGLIDAIEAARRSITVITSFAPGDIDAKRVSTPGPKLLEQIIDYAAGEYEGAAAGSDREVPPLIADLAARIHDAGYKTATDFGFEGSLRIPLVVGSPEVPGTWAVAVLLDDEAYVAEPSLRRRDRHRVEAFENHGWKVVQTYSTSLFIDPVGQADAVIAAMEQVLDEIRPPAAVSVPQLGDWGDQWIDEQAQTSVENQVPRGDDVRAERLPDAGKPETTQTSLAQAPDSASNSRWRGERRRRTAKRPQVTAGLPLSAYSDDELDDMTLWLLGNGKQYTEDELVQALRDEIALQRRGAQVDAVLRNVVRRVLNDAQ
ncbi:MAG: hypothetical protein SPI14_00645 [Arcanobacterium sp.]|nr:hypothetical protein [Arcanobacterium sp.]